VTTLWDTTGTEVVRKLAAERRSGGVASGLALTLVVVTDERRVPEVEEAVPIAAAAHPYRLLLVTRLANQPSRVPDRLDAEIVVGGRVGGCEAVIMRMQGRLALHAESVVVPLLAPDVPVVTWWHGPPPDRISTDPLGVAAERRITDCAQADDPVAALHRRAVDYAAGDTDLCWTRLTGLRTLVAGGLDGLSGEVTDAAVRAPAQDAGAALLSGWLADRLGLAPAREEPAPDGAGGLEGVTLDLSGGGRVSLTRQDSAVELARTGQEPRTIPLLHRTLGELLAEELRRLGTDRSYAGALSAATGISGLHARPRARVHTWVDPEEVPA
jgi:glucose-6-phosphate dehydrogenase assembly protein OpcA